MEGNLAILEEDFAWVPAEKFIFSSHDSGYTDELWSATSLIHTWFSTTAQVQNAHAEHLQTTSESCVMSVSAFEVGTFFQLFERRRSWSSILLKIYRPTAHCLKNKKCACGRAVKNARCVKYESGLIVSQSWKGLYHKKLMNQSRVVRDEQQALK